jgi:hypothetical protein
VGLSVRRGELNPRSSRSTVRATQAAQVGSNGKKRGAPPVRQTAAEVLKSQRLGVSVHVLVGECLQDGLRHPSPAELIARAGRHAVTVDSRAVHRQAAKQAVVTTAAIYFRWFTPPEAWEFIGTEVKAHGCRFDLVWQAAGLIVVDEIKSGAAAVPGRDGFEPQVAGLVRGGETKYEDAFVGVRVILLAAPALSYLASPGGGRKPLL